MPIQAYARSEFERCAAGYASRLGDQAGLATAPTGSTVVLSCCVMLDPALPGFDTHRRVMQVCCPFCLLTSMKHAAIIAQAPAAGPQRLSTH